MINAKLSDIIAATSPTGGELVYLVQGGNSRKLALGAIGGGLLDDTGRTTALATLGVNARIYDDLAGKITSPALHGGSIETMFADSSYSIYVIPAGTYTFAAAFTIPANSIVLAENGAIFQPTFEPTGAARATPLITLGEGVQANYLKLSLPTGINTIRIGVKVQSNTQIGYFEATSVDLNNNRTEAGSTDLISGALLIEDAEHVRIGQVYLNRFDRGWAVIDSTDVVIGKIRNLETIMGGYVHGTRDLHVLAGYTTGPTDPTLPNSFSRGVMSPGANSLCLAGCSDSSFSNWYTYDILEHAVRVGAMAGGTSIPNHRLSFVNHKHFRPYGCGHKQDDGDVFNIKYVTIQGLYTEDVGHNNWFGSPGYTNWSTAIDNPAIDNDGNKQGLAIRNSQHVTFSDFSNKANLYSHSGYFGLWIESSNYVQGSNIDTEKSRHDGVVIQSGASVSPDRIELRGVATRENTDSGLLLDFTPSNVNCRGLCVFDLDSQLNGGYGYEVTGRQDGASPFVTLKSRVEGIAFGNTAGSFLIDSDVLADSDFIDDVTETGSWTPNFTFATPGDLSLGSVSASGTWKREGRWVTFEGSYSATVTHTTASGNLRITGLPYAAADGDNIVTMGSVPNLSSWNSRTMLVAQVINTTSYMELRGYAAASAGSPMATGNVTTGSTFAINFAGRYKV